MKGVQVYENGLNTSSNYTEGTDHILNVRFSSSGSALQIISNTLDFFKDKKEIPQ